MRRFRNEAGQLFNKTFLRRRSWMLFRRHRLLATFLLLVGLSGQWLGQWRGHWRQSAWEPRIQAHGLVQTPLSLERQQRVKEAFKFAWDGYSKYAWGHDEIRPVSLSYTDTRNGWGASIVDAMSTLWVMDMQPELAAAINHSINIDFQRPDAGPVSTFETTIRYVAGLLSAYELSGTSYPGLLTKAVELAGKLTDAWSGSPAHRIPHAWLDFDRPGIRPTLQRTTTLAEAGTLTIEFDRLSFYTGNDIYRQLATNASRALMSHPQILPGLHSQTIIPDSDLSRGDVVGWGAGTDSFEEYGVKYWHLVGNDALDFISYWNTSVYSSIKYLIRREANHTYLTEIENGQQRGFSSHLACFAAGNWVLGGKLLHDPTIMAYGLELAEGCWASYNTTTTGIGPETFSFSGQTGRVVAIDRGYGLRPEVIESYWYIYRLTGDTIWQDRAWEAFQALERYCKTLAGYSGIDDATSKLPAMNDKTESFLFSEVFKYLYLIFSPPDILSLDEFVFNTEAHPFRRYPAQTSSSI